MSTPAKWLIVCLLLLPVELAQGQPEEVAAPLPEMSASSKLQTITRAEYLAQIARMQTLVDSCKAQASACGDDRVPDDALVEGKFTTDWDWLRLVLNLCKDPRQSDRARQLEAAGNRLADETGHLTDGAQPVADSDARSKAQAILAQSEFNRVQKNSYFAAKLAALGLLLNRLFEGTGRLLPKAWWIAPMLEYGTLLLAAIGVVLWAWRLNRQERLRIDAGPKPSAAWHAESEGWAERAEEEARKASWREAVHCVYWSAIVMLEGQRLWTQNRTRTPREYLSLLAPGSERQTQLRDLTGAFERIWYGLRPAAESDYRDAKAALDQMRSA